MLGFNGKTAHKFWASAEDRTQIWGFSGKTAHKFWASTDGENKRGVCQISGGKKRKKEKQTKRATDKTVFSQVSEGHEKTHTNRGFNAHNSTTEDRTQIELNK